VRVLYLSGTTITLVHLTIRDGRCSDGANGAWNYGSPTAGGPGSPGAGFTMPAQPRCSIVS
jgi:hypothetical protein